MQNPIVVRLSAADVQQISDHLATVLVMYHLAPAPTPQDAPHRRDEEDVGQALLYLDDGSDVDNVGVRLGGGGRLGLLRTARVLTPEARGEVGCRGGFCAQACG